MNISKLIQVSAFLSLLALTISAKATLLLSDDFTVGESPDTKDLNYKLSSRQTGTLAPQAWTKYNTDYGSQVGNAVSDYGQPGGTANGDFLLLADSGKASLAGMPLSSDNVDGPLTISFDMFNGSSSIDDDSWTAFTMTNNILEGWGWGASGFPQVPGLNEFAFRKLWNGTDGIIYIGGVGETTVKLSGNHFSLILSDIAGTGSAFSGHGTKLRIMNGKTILGTFELHEQMTKSFITFSGNSGRPGGIDNLRIETRGGPFPFKKNGGVR